MPRESHNWRRLWSSGTQAVLGDAGTVPIFRWDGTGRRSGPYLGSQDRAGIMFAGAVTIRLEGKYCLL
jgi:hypothetical protein